ncbi:putative heat shock protein [Pseudomonas syringae pv. maculicola]|uniref:Putative heat shock protein n=2 Tax=Pseudomonas syringae group genomosp. 3 TaxID=251701 RepID=A0A3M6CJY4_PSEYM|nr:ATP-binding protein [Pseudomonas syringae group genomosp. 3]MBM0212751.1 ATP-binding protein [Pseudomonas syringae pv. maculicola]RMM79755.1 putative heat shock protein [Pseudomonas syringae pv. maculicola]RMV43741.1 putative heat shock protein [Pseudomonas syringae pv. maculicola]
MDMHSSSATNDCARIHRAGVDLNGLMSVLGKHLYSSPTVALRELVQNAHDSILRRRLEGDWQGMGRIDVIGDPQANTISIIDTGAGLTEHEIHAYLATVGVGYTRGLREAGEEAGGLIGMFGLGFLSAFVLANRVIVRSTSYQQPNLGFCYQSSNGEQYSVVACEARPVGTHVTLELHEHHRALAEAPRLRTILERYCALLEVPIHVGAGAGEAINRELPPWRLSAGGGLHPLQLHKRQLAFAEGFEHTFKPICCMPVYSLEQTDLQGLLWVQDGATYGSNDNRNLSVFLRGMLLDDNARDLLPSWAGFIGGVIESRHLTPRASREALQRDQHYLETRHAIGEALIDGLVGLAEHQPQAWRRVLSRHNESLLGATLCDQRLFDLLKDSLSIPTSQGELPVRHLVVEGAVHVLLDSQDGFETMLFHALGFPVAHGNRYAVLPFLRLWCEVQGMRLVELGSESGNRQLFTPVSLPTSQLDWLSTRLAVNEELVVARFAPEALPLVVVSNHEAQLKARLESDEADRHIASAALHLARQYTQQITTQAANRLYLNFANPAIQALIQAVDGNQPGALNAARLLKAFKVIIAGQAALQTPSALTEALEGLAQSMQVLLAR